MSITSTFPEESAARTDREPQKVSGWEAGRRRILERTVTERVVQKTQSDADSKSHRKGVGWQDADARKGSDAGDAMADSREERA